MSFKKVAADSSVFSEVARFGSLFLFELMAGLFPANPLYVKYAIRCYRNDAGGEEI